LGEAGSLSSLFQADMLISELPPPPLKNTKGEFLEREIRGEEKKEIGGIG